MQKLTTETIRVLKHSMKKGKNKWEHYGSVDSYIRYGKSDQRKSSAFLRIAEPKTDYTIQLKLSSQISYTNKYIFICIYR